MFSNMFFGGHCSIGTLGSEIDGKINSRFTFNGGTVGNVPHGGIQLEANKMTIVQGVGVLLRGSNNGVTLTDSVIIGNYNDIKGTGNIVYGTGNTYDAKVNNEAASILTAEAAAKSLLAKYRGETAKKTEPFQKTLLDELNAKDVTRNSIASTYANAIMSLQCVDWNLVHNAIVAKWSLSGLKYVKEMAEKLKRERCS